MFFSGPSRFCEELFPLPQDGVRLGQRGACDFATAPRFPLARQCRFGAAETRRWSVMASLTVDRLRREILWTWMWASSIKVRIWHALSCVDMCWQHDLMFECVSNADSSDKVSVPAGLYFVKHIPGCWPKCHNGHKLLQEESSKIQHTSPRLWFGCGLWWLESNCFGKLSKVFREAFQILNVFLSHFFTMPFPILQPF